MKHRLGAHLQNHRKGVRVVCRTGSRASAVVRASQSQRLHDGSVRTSSMYASAAATLSTFEKIETSGMSSAPQRRTPHRNSRRRGAQISGPMLGAVALKFRARPNVYHCGGAAKRALWPRIQSHASLHLRSEHRQTAAMPQYRRHRALSQHRTGRDRGASPMPFEPWKPPEKSRDCHFSKQQASSQCSRHGEWSERSGALRIKRHWRLRRQVLLARMLRNRIE